jgi:beta-barrel assembly-enhancing protease
MEMLMFNKLKLGLIVLIISITTFSCSTLMRLNVFPVSKDVELGQQFDAEIQKSPKEYPLLKDRPDVKAYVENIGKKILASPDISYREQFAYKFEIIKDDSTINAFCTPGGYVYVYTGLLKFVDNEATLAGVIAHEIAHAERRHSTNKMTAQYGVEALIGMASGKLGESGTQVAGVVAGLGLLKYNRSEEAEADLYSFKYLQSTEYYPGGIRFFFEKIGVGRSGGAFERLLSTHPLPQDRFDHINKLLSDAGNPQAKESNLFTARYKDFKRTLP